MRSVSVLVPTLNSERTLAACLGALRAQRYPAEALEIVVADGGSSDRTRAIALEHGARVVDNPLRTGEAGKAAALRAARHELVALIDSDNIVVGPDWLERMTAPFADPAVVGAEPLRFVAEPEDTVIDRYCALIGANDPFCLFAGVYDKHSLLTGRWTGLPVAVAEREGWFTFALAQPLPTIGANGTVYRRAALEGIVGDYLMDVDLPVVLGTRIPGARFAKVDVGIRHLFCSDTRAFVRKQTRRVRDYFSPEARAEPRVYPWGGLVAKAAARFVLACVTVVPLLAQSLRLYARSRDPAAFYHPVAAWLTLGVYGTNVLFARGRPLSRTGWKQ